MIFKIREKGSRLDEGETDVSLNQEDSVFDLADFLCSPRGIYHPRAPPIPSGNRPKAPNLLCGQFSIPDVVKPMIGPLLDTTEDKMLDQNPFFVFEFLKKLVLNLVFGAFNYFYDALKLLVHSSVKDLLPSGEKTLFELFLMFTLIMISIKFSLKLAIAICPYGWARGVLLRLQVRLFGI